jgi:uncharacterized protein YggE
LVDDALSTKLRVEKAWNLIPLLGVKVSRVVKGDLVDMNRKSIIVSVLALATVLLMTACSFDAANPASAQSSPVATTTTVPLSGGSTGRVITVVGTGQASGTPDVATVNIGIDTQSSNVQQAVSDNRTKMNALLDALKGQGIADNDIQTSNYSVYTEQQQNSPGKTPTASALTYRVSNQVNVTVRDVSKLGDVLDTVVSAGANNVYGVSFSVADPSSLQGDARAKAMADAKVRAESLASLAGVGLGDVVSISEVVNSVTPMYRAEAVASGVGGTPIQPGTLDVSMSVQVSYAIR